MASNRKVRVKTRTNSDPLTGEWHGGIDRLTRQPGAVVMLVRDWNPARHESPPTPIPMKLHRHETSGHLGGCDYTGEMQRYLKGVVFGATSTRAHGTYAERHWWTPLWAEAELRAHWPADVVDIVLSVRRDQQSWDMAMQGSDRALGDVIAMMRQMAAHCRLILRGEGVFAAA